jgi:phage terminase large subunit-like protein
VLKLAQTPGLRIALVGPTEDEVRSVMIEGASGVIASAPDDERPIWEPSLGRLTWANGTQAFVRSGANPEALRGPEHDYAWCDELAKWVRAEASWDNLMFGLRRGVLPRVLVTTTPGPTPLMRKLAARGDVALTRGRTADAALLAPSVVDACGIVVCALGADGVAYVLADASVSGLSPEGWAREVAATAEKWRADRVVAEGNQGGAMVASVLRATDIGLPVRMVHASIGKAARAEPVAALLERGAAKFRGRLSRARGRALRPGRGRRL